jgi:hypothetical protein
VTGIIELYEDRQSGWRVLICRGATIGYRFIIVDRAGHSTFAADAMELASGRVPAGLEQVDLDVDSPRGMVLIEPCALWSGGSVRRTRSKPGVLTAAYISGEEISGASGGKPRRTAQGLDTRLVVAQVARLVAANERLQRANRELTEENERLRAELTTIGAALGRMTGGRRRRGRRGAAVLALPDAGPLRRRRPITATAVLARRDAGLARARMARPEQPAAARVTSEAAG